MTDPLQLDPTRQYSAGEVRVLLTERDVRQLRSDVDAAEKMVEATQKVASETAESVGRLVTQVEELAGIVKAHVELPNHPATAAALDSIRHWQETIDQQDDQLGFANMSPDERRALPSAVRSFVAGQASMKGRENMWRKIALYAGVLGVGLTILSAFGVTTWFRMHVLGLGPGLP